MRSPQRVVTRRGWKPSERVLTTAQICGLADRIRDPRYRPVPASRAPAPPLVVIDRLQAVQGATATAAASSRRRHIGHLADAPGARLFYGGQQPLVILMAGFAAAQVRGYCPGTGFPGPFR